MQRVNVQGVTQEQIEKLKRLKQTSQAPVGKHISHHNYIPIAKAEPTKVGSKNGRMCWNTLPDHWATYRIH